MKVIFTLKMDHKGKRNWGGRENPNYNPLPLLQQLVFVCSPSPVLPTLRPHSLSTRSQYSLHYSLLPFHRHAHHRTSFYSLPFHTTLHINRTGISICMINNEYITPSLMFGSCFSGCCPSIKLGVDTNLNKGHQIFSQQIYSDNKT